MRRERGREKRGERGEREERKRMEIEKGE